MARGHVFNKKVVGHLGLCRGKENTSIFLPIKAGEAIQILLSGEVYITMGRGSKTDLIK
jgi:hypothetical protein